VFSPHAVRISGVDSPIVCPITIGREPHLSAIDRLLDQLLSGSGQALLVTGEAGIGKSRLVAETRARAAERDVLVLQGQCFETDRSLPYAPFVDLLRGFAGSNELELREQHDLAQLLPELVETPLAAAPGLDPEQQKRQLFRAMNDLVSKLARTRPLLLIVEDVHWADETSLDLLRALARTTAQRPLLLMLTYRSDEVDDNLRGLLTALDRERLGMELRLQRLSTQQLDLMLGAIFQVTRPGRAEFLDLLYTLTEGNPFFVEEVLRALVGAGDIFLDRGSWNRKPLDELRVPRSVDDAVRRRTAQLSSAAREVIQLAAVAGRRFDFELLGTLSGLDEAQLLATVKELIAAGLIVEESADQLAFRHALTRQAVYAGLLARERRALHRRVAETLEQLGRGGLDDSVAELAYHYAEAGQAEPALGYARRAGERALHMYAPHAAIEQFDRAIQAARQLGIEPEPELLRLNGQAHDLTGDFVSAESAYTAAAEAARSVGDRPTEWQALLDLSLLWAGQDYERTGAFANAALELARHIGDQRLIAQTLNRIGNWHMNRDQPADAVRCHEQALALFDSMDDERGRAETLELLGMASMGDPRRSAAYYGQAIPLLRKLDDRPRLVTSLLMRMVVDGAYLYEGVPLPSDGSGVSSAEAAACSEEALRIIRDMDWPAGESFALWETALWLGPHGRYGRALATAREGLAIATQIDHRQWMAGALVTLGSVYLDMHALPDAEKALVAALARAREVSSDNFLNISAAGLARTYVAQRRLNEASTLLQTRIAPGTPMDTVGKRLCWITWGDIQLASGEPAAALDTADRLITTGGPGVAAHVWHLRGDALAALGRTAEAVDVLRAALLETERIGTRGRQWRIAASLARVLRGLGRRDEAEHVLGEARQTLNDLALEIDDAALRANYLRETTALVPPSPAATPARAAKERFGGLTTREREVARLIARGLSNRGIADQLVLGERTVESYVGNILGKLNFTSRAQIAAWAVESGLNSESP
jgi:DNA-binding CsgD family transcriptional regulator/predicted negative regulator of RcsB-dependent stress response